MKKIDDLMAAVRANPMGAFGWALVLLVLLAAGFALADGLSEQFYVFTH